MRRARRLISVSSDWHWTAELLVRITIYPLIGHVMRLAED